ncbi:MAG: hypothetical protein KDJ37_12450 [Hyphomicrobiaceae bacterium]|nr:hypothetical protein [Hyphomicrobiaceae bacterium]
MKPGPNSLIGSLRSKRSANHARQTFPSLLLVFAATCVAVLALSPVHVRAGDEERRKPNAAHDIAQRFAGEQDADQRDAARHDANRLKRYEDEMLARARSEAEARKREELERQEAEARERQTRAARARYEAAQRAAEHAARIKAETEAREAAERRAAEAKSRQQAAEREREAQALSERLRAARDAKIARDVAAKQMELIAATERAREALRQRTRRLGDRVAENERRQAAARQRAEQEIEAATRQRAEDAAESAETVQRVTTQHITTGATGRVPTDAAGYVNVERNAFGDGASDHRVAVLMVMKPGSRGIRRWNKTADPMLCIEADCYISRGRTLPAERISRAKGFGPSIALGKRAGACRGHLACVFRDVAFGKASVWFQPVDLKILRHDRRTAQTVSIDRSCHVRRGVLSCANPVIADGYLAWIVPERVAEAAGPEAIEAAIAAGLSEVTHARFDRYR